MDKKLNTYLEQIYMESFISNTFNRLRSLVIKDKNKFNQLVSAVVSETQPEVLAQVNSILSSNQDEDAKFHALLKIVEKYPDQFTNPRDAITEGFLPGDAVGKTILGGVAAILLAASLIVGSVIYTDVQTAKEFATYEAKGETKMIGKQMIYIASQAKQLTTVTPSSLTFYKVYKYGHNLEKEYKQPITQEEYEQLDAKIIKR